MDSGILVIHEENHSVKVVRKTFQFGNHKVTLETGRIARQADGAVLITMDETVLLVTAVGQKTVNRRGIFFL